MLAKLLLLFVSLYIVSCEGCDFTENYSKQKIKKPTKEYNEAELNHKLLDEERKYHERIAKIEQKTQELKEPGNSITAAKTIFSELLGAAGIVPDIVSNAKAKEKFETLKESFSHYYDNFIKKDEEEKTQAQHYEDAVLAYNFEKDNNELVENCYLLKKALQEAQKNLNDALQIAIEGKLIKTKDGCVLVKSKEPPLKRVKNEYVNPIKYEFVYEKNGKSKFYFAVIDLVDREQNLTKESYEYFEKYITPLRAKEDIAFNNLFDFEYNIADKKGFDAWNSFVINNDLSYQDKTASENELKRLDGYKQKYAQDLQSFADEVKEQRKQKYEQERQKIENELEKLSKAKK